jgi:uncharacterized integral membrane protein
MFNLFKAEIKTLLKWRAILYTIISMCILGVFVILNNDINEDPTLGGIFEFNYIVIMVSSIIMGLFLYRDYSQNTIRNKIIVGNSRISIYFSKALTTFVALIINAFVFGLTAMCGGYLFGDLSYIKWDVFLQNYIVVISTLLVVSSFISFLSINIQSALGAVLPMMLLFAIMFISMIYMEMLAINENTEMLELLRTIPITSAISLSETIEPANWQCTALIGVIMSFCLLYGGYIWFSRSDIK